MCLVVIRQLRWGSGARWSQLVCAVGSGQRNAFFLLATINMERIQWGYRGEVPTSWADDNALLGVSVIRCQADLVDIQLLEDIEDIDHALIVGVVGAFDNCGQSRFGSLLAC